MHAISEIGDPTRGYPNNTLIIDNLCNILFSQLRFVQKDHHY